MNEQQDSQIVEQQWLITGEVTQHLGEKVTMLQMVDADSGTIAAFSMPHSNIELAVATAIAMANDFERILLEAVELNQAQREE